MEETSRVWRWNDRLAMVAGGLTLLLLGIFIGRVWGPDGAPQGNIDEPIATVAATQLPDATKEVPSEVTPYEEVNPPELIVDEEPFEPATPASSPAPAVSTKAAAAKPTVVASLPQTAEPTSDAVATRGESAKPDSSPSVAIPQTSPVSLTGKVTTIKPLASTQVCEPVKKFKDRKLSTVLTWAESVQEASEQAEEKEKLVFLIHVSGNFEMPGFT